MHDRYFGAILLDEKERMPVYLKICTHAKGRKMNKFVKKAAVVMLGASMFFGTVAATSTTAMANEPVRFAVGCQVRATNCPLGGMMWDEDGNFLTCEAFEERLDTWVAEGLITYQDRELMLERFDWCGQIGVGATGVRGSCVRQGRGRVVR